MSLYSNLPLDSSKSEIRLISLHDSDDENALLSGQLERTTLNDDYSALSYVWGDDHDRRPIQLNGVNTTITANLEKALKQLRAEKKATKIWIDAICINQRDNTEKSHQVQMMGEIYKHANIRTVLWLGNAENDSHEALQLIATADAQFFVDYDPSAASPALQALKILLKRTWWKRMWVVQEMMLSPNPVLKCGADEVDFERLVIFRNLHWEAQSADLERFQPLRNLWRECPFTPMLEYHRVKWLDGELSLWLMDVAPFQCRYLRDKVYGLMGLIHPDIRKQITVSYNEEAVTDKMVFIEATWICFHRELLIPLQFGQVEKNTSLGLPSWCPDWNSKQKHVPLVGFGFAPYPVTSSFRPPADKWLFGGEKEIKPRFAFSGDKETLFLHGFVVDTVDFVNGVGTEETPEVIVYTGDDLAIQAQCRQERLESTKKACLRWEAHIRTSKSVNYLDSDGGYEEAFFRTIAANRTFSRKALDSDVKPIFDAWIGRDIASDGSSSSTTVETKRIKDYSNSVVSLCAKRTFITTTTGYFGLAPQITKLGDLVCIVYGADVAFILRKPEPELGNIPGSFIGEAYIHGIMQGEYLEKAKDEDFTAFWMK
ncbi:hypothetical protein B5807_12187 [Epicoccum nigrum]|uniref:Heterokaryon incompatibility domain-containing protein n=1 Tax=Epicoccum nigrum TaxID=105696 RepID=A0A1Y2LGQ9_EPING|nr:hypothetical protein B5807_12187 [Epicoccum nigrum]